MPIDINKDVGWRRGDTPQWDGTGWRQAAKPTANQFWAFNGTTGLWAPRVLAVSDLPSGLTGIDFLVGTATGNLSAEIAVGTTPGGELGGTWASPTVDATHSGSAHHNQVHGASDHTDRTRRVYIPAVAFSAAGTGAPTFAVTGGASVGFPNWAIDGTNDEDVVTEIGMPIDWDNGNISLYIIWRPTDTNTGNVAWRMFINAQEAGAAGNSAIEVNTGTVVSAASGTQYATTIHSMGTYAPGTGTLAPLLRLTVYRFASDAADTYNAHDAHFCGIYIEYTADM